MNCSGRQMLRGQVVFELSRRERSVGLQEGQDFSHRFLDDRQVGEELVQGFGWLWLYWYLRN